MASLYIVTLLNRFYCTSIVTTWHPLAGASKQLGTIIEGESLLNDGAAIVLFNVFKDELIPGQGRNGL